MLQIGIKGECNEIVTEKNSAASMRSGELSVYATPSMIALMENAAVNAVLSCLGEGEGTVGTLLNVAHSSATPIGMKVWAEATLTAGDGKKLTYEVAAFDEAGEIGRGTHERFVIKPERFLAKAQGKLSK